MCITIALQVLNITKGLSPAVPEYQMVMLGEHEIAGLPVQLVLPEKPRQPSMEAFEFAWYLS